MKKIRMLWAIVKRCQLDKFFIGYIICFFAASGLIVAVEPGINTYRESLWYLFVASSSIGFGDVVVVTAIGKLTTVFVLIYEVIVVAMISGVIVTHYLEVVETKQSETTTMFMDKLEHLSELSHEELVELEANIRYRKEEGDKKIEAALKEKKRRREIRKLIEQRKKKQK